jgi:hypothetical protein
MAIGTGDQDRSLKTKGRTVTKSAVADLRRLEILRNARMAAFGSVFSACQGPVRAGRLGA